MNLVKQNSGQLPLELLLAQRKAFTCCYRSFTPLFHKQYHIGIRFRCCNWARIFLILLFVLTGISLHIHGLWQEIRIADTPLTVSKAAELAAYAQMLAHYLLEHRAELSREIYLTYFTNRFRAARYGFDAVIIDPAHGLHIPLAEDILRERVKS